MTQRSMDVKRLECVCCEIEDVPQPSPTEAHHLNLDGHAGQKRLGDEYQIPICGWHHRAVRRMGMGCDAMTRLYGPSLALDSKQFHFAYGSDMELHAATQHKLARLEPAIA